MQCLFNVLSDEVLARYREHLEQVADAMLLDHASLSVNPRDTLYRDQGLIEITEAGGNQLASIPEQAGPPAPDTLPRETVVPRR